MKAAGCKQTFLPNFIAKEQMARIKIDLPGRFLFATSIPVRITDINYGNHVGNDAVLSIIHEARVQFLKNFGYTELEFAGAGMIMRDVIIEFKNELFYGDVVIASVAVRDFSNVGFDIYYKLEKNTGEKTILVATAKTGMVCFDYTRKKIVPLPAEAKEKLQ
jgi:acyl-CoA thioesterase FadM